MRQLAQLTILDGERLKHADTVKNTNPIQTNPGVKGNEGVS